MSGAVLATHAMLPALLMVLLVPLLFRGSAGGLSTNFGRNSRTDTSSDNPPLRGKLCTTADNCIAFINTTCMEDPRDSSMRCLCDDRSIPKNGVCRNAFRDDSSSEVLPSCGNRKSQL